MEIRWFGTACLTMQHGGHTILFDPFIPMDQSMRNKFPFQEFHSIDSIVITHGHFDHLVDVPYFLGISQAVVYCSPISAATLQREGVDPARIRIINRGDQLQLGPFDIKVLNGRHVVFDRALIFRTVFSLRLLLNLKPAFKIMKLSKEYVEGNMFIFDITVADARLLHLGSLNLDERENYPRNIDIMTVPFQGRSDIHRYAADLIKKVDPKSIYLHHFDDTFPPISNYIDPSKLIDLLKTDGSSINIIVPDYYQPFHAAADDYKPLKAKTDVQIDPIKPITIR